jgi:hypothetical protein
MFLKVSGKAHAVANIEAAALKYREIWDAAIMKNRVIRGAVISVDGLEVYTVSQNGKVWAGQWSPTAKPVFELVSA